MPTASDPNTQYFAMPDTFAGAQPPAPGSAIQALLAQFLMPQPGQGGQGQGVPNPNAPSPMFSHPMIMRDPGMSAGPQQSQAPPIGPMIPPPMPQGAPGQSSAPMGGSSPAMSALQQQMTMPPPMQSQPPNMGAPPQPPASNNAPAMPQMPNHKENNLVKIIGAIAGLMGGSGGQVAGSYLDAQKANDTANYGRAMQQYQMQQAQQQQQFQNTQQQARSSDSLLDNLAGKDAGTQQSIVEGMTPQIMQAYGYTPDSIKAQFYNADGAFKPVSGGADAKGDAATLRAQTTAQARLHQLTPAAQQNIHDGMDQGTFETTYGISYEGFQPGQNAKDVAGATSAQTRADAETAAAQKGALSTLLTMKPAMQASIHAGTDPQAFAQKYGVPANAFKPGMTQKDANNLAAVAERAAASRLAASTQTTLANGRNTLQAYIASTRNAITERGQDLTHGDRQATLANKAQVGGASGSAADTAYARRLQRMTVLATPAKDPITGQPSGLSPAHQGGAAYTEYMNLKKLNNAYEAKNSGAGGSQANSAAPPNPYLHMTPDQRLSLARQRGLIK